MSSRKQPVTFAIRAERRKRAEERQAKYDELSIKEKLDRLPPVPAAKKQRARLEALLQKQSEKKEEKSK